ASRYCLSSYSTFFAVSFVLFFVFFFFQAEDGIRDFHVTGVQTCALPISCATCGHCGGRDFPACSCSRRGGSSRSPRSSGSAPRRSEERRVGKECRSWWSPDQ